MNFESTLLSSLLIKRLSYCYLSVPLVLHRYVSVEKPGKNPAPAGYKRKPLKHFNRKASLTQRTDRKRTKIDIKKNKRKPGHRVNAEGRNRPYFIF